MPKKQKSKADREIAKLIKKLESKVASTWEILKELDQICLKNNITIDDLEQRQDAVLLSEHLDELSEKLSELLVL